VREPLSWREIGRLITRRYARRSLLGFSLMAAQAFFYNAIFFTYALVLARFYGVPDERVGLHILPFAAGNFLGPLVLGWMFDAVGRRIMIAATYAISAVALVATGFAFTHGALSAAAQTACWSGIFFVASSAASSAYLTVSEIFPLEMRAVAISVFYALGTGIGGFVGPALFGTLIGTQNREAVFAGYVLAALLMLLAAVVAARLGVDAERRSLEEVARPLSSE
jgi:MFS family permease